MKKFPLFIIIIMSLSFSSVFAKKQFTSEQLDYMAIKRLKHMSLKEKIGQKLMLDFNYWCVKSPDANLPCKEVFTKANASVKKILSQNHIGGVILFSGNIKNAAQITTLTYELQQAMALNKRMPLLIATDQEGGIVVRLPRDSTVSFPGNMAMAAAYLGKPDMHFVAKTAAIIANNLKAVGINTNFAPDVDVNLNPQNPIIHVRSFSDDPKLVAELGLEYSRALQAEDIASTLKHFPGHGDTDMDSHVGLPIVNHNMEEAWSSDLYPFKNIIEHSPPDCIMTAHIQFPALDNSTILASKTGEYIKTPATFSRTIQQNLLREQLGFQGIIISDALDMGAIAKNFEPLDACIKAFQAGVDIALMPLSITEADKAIQMDKFIEALEAAVLNGTLSETELNESVLRIIALKIKLGLLKPDVISLEQKINHTKKVLADPKQRVFEDYVAENAVTLVQSHHELIPIHLVQGARIYISTPDLEQGKGIAKELEQLQENNQVPADIHVRFSQLQHPEFNLEAELKAIDDADIVIIGNRSTKSQSFVGKTANSLDNFDSFKQSKPELVLGKSALSLKNIDIYEAQRAFQLLEYATNHKKKTIFISLLAPYDLAIYKDVSEAMLAVYNPFGYIDTTAGQGYYRGPQMQALTKIIFGIRKASAKLPVNIPSILNLKEILYPRGFGLYF